MAIAKLRTAAPGRGLSPYTGGRAQSKRRIIALLHSWQELLIGEEYRFRGNQVRQSVISSNPYNFRMTYTPAPIDTSHVELSDDILRLTEQLAQNAHELWAQERVAQGWRHGKERHDGRKEHPSLVPYEQLSEAEKVFDRNTAMGTLKAILALGYRITRK